MNPLMIMTIVAGSAFGVIAAFLISALLTLNDVRKTSEFGSGFVALEDYCNDFHVIAESKREGNLH